MTRIAAIVLAAGASRRMGGDDKLTRVADGQPLLRKIADAALASRASETRVVLGAHRETRTAVLGGAVRIVVNENWETGMASSIRAGIESLAPDTDGALIVLGDMPEVDATLLDALIGGFDPSSGAEIVRPRARSGPVGNPVLFGKRFFPALAELSGDTGAKSVILSNPAAVRDVPADDGVLVDLDTPEAWAAWQRSKNG